MPLPMYQPVEVGVSVLIWPSGSDSKLPSSTDATPASAGVQTRAARPNPDKAKHRSFPTSDSPNHRARLPRNGSRSASTLALDRVFAAAPRIPIQNRQSLGCFLLSSPSRECRSGAHLAQPLGAFAISMARCPADLYRGGGTAGAIPALASQE